ncbi:hypothetical protein SISSUDRAFT_1066815 [Sistotremastrum suecicum HHB10207 ss-3]|uniref:Uncharacterized protein n=1 Tax=Sistotremastrum suecicum HHB10207 ss-3 TaxID=1314776 RepID=A0A165XVH4_9AGAM|nr:hypothetical protein SISSUDRAFT_1066815 [Sistotremastrum suecicum HHB10207 ss-3]
MNYLMPDLKPSRRLIPQKEVEGILAPTADRLTALHSVWAETVHLLRESQSLVSSETSCGYFFPHSRLFANLTDMRLFSYLNNWLAIREGWFSTVSRDITGLSPFRPQDWRDFLVQSSSTKEVQRTSSSVSQVQGRKDAVRQRLNIHLYDGNLPSSSSQLMFAGHTLSSTHAEIQSHPLRLLLWELNQINFMAELRFLDCKLCSASDSDHLLQARREDRMRRAGNILGGGRLYSSESVSEGLASPVVAEALEAIEMFRECLSYWPEAPASFLIPVPQSIAHHPEAKITHAELARFYVRTAVAHLGRLPEMPRMYPERT